MHLGTRTVYKPRLQEIMASDTDEVSINSIIEKLLEGEVLHNSCPYKTGALVASDAPWTVRERAARAAIGSGAVGTLSKIEGRIPQPADAFGAGASHQDMR